MIKVIVVFLGFIISSYIIIRSAEDFFQKL